jgi:hypothetical protein
VAEGTEVAGTLVYAEGRECLDSASCSSTPRTSAQRVKQVGGGEGIFATEAWSKDKVNGKTGER